MMEVATQEPNVIKCTNKRGQYEQLEKLLEGLSKCQKALSNYLETKRLAFPRFYFVAPADLLDILSNSNNPRKVHSYERNCRDYMNYNLFEDSN